MDMRIDRRSFVGGAGALVGAAAWPAIARAAESEAIEGSSSQDEDSAKSPNAITDVSSAGTYDVVVVGAGTSGLVTALSAAEEGLSVAVVTASTTPIARGGSVNAVYSSYMESLGLPRVDVSNYKREIALNLTNVDQRKWYRFFNNSETTIDWLIDIMQDAGYAVAVELNDGIPEESLYHQPLCSHGFFDPADTPDGNGAIGNRQDLVVDTLASRIEREGGAVIYGRVAQRLEREDGGTGRVGAVIAQNPDGAYERYVGTKAVVLATGDFTKNREMVEKHCNWYVDKIASDVYDTPVDYDTTMSLTGCYAGDGHRMALEVGAAWQHNNPCAVMDGSTMPGPHHITYQSCWSLLLNSKGERYMDEYTSCLPAVFASNTQPAGDYWAIWTPQYYDYAGDLLYPDKCAYGMTDVPTLDEQLEMWDASADCKADTIDGLVEQMGLPRETALASIERYNQMCAQGEDTDFYKDPSMLIPVSEGPFYAQKKPFTPPTYVLGGIRNDQYMRILDENDDPIPGFYCVGTMIGDFYSGYYTFQSCGINYGATCLTFGYLTGKFIAQNE